MKTTIQISGNTLERLKRLKNFNRESYDYVLNRVIDNFEEEDLTDADIKSIQISLEQIRKGETIPLEVVAKKRGIKLD